MDGDGESDYNRNRRGRICIYLNLLAMDDILKKAMFSEVADVMERIEEITEKYKHSGELVYSAAFGFLEEEGETENRWSLAYGHNCKDPDEFEEFMTLQVQAFSVNEEEDPFPGLYLN